MREGLSKVEPQVKGPFFNGEAFGLVDCAYAPLFMRMALLESWYSMGLLEGMPGLESWSRRLLACAPVKQSVVEEFPALYRAMIAKSGSHAAERFGES